MKCLAVLLVLSLAAVLAPALTAEAGTTVITSFSYTREGGYPESGVDPERTIESASASVYDEGISDILKAKVTMGAVPTEATDSRVHIGFGNLDHNWCQITWEQSVSAARPETGLVRAGTLRLSIPLAGGQENWWDCSYVWTSADGQFETYDRYYATPDCCQEVGSSTYGARIQQHDPVSVRVGRWTTVALQGTRLHDDLGYVGIKGREPSVRVRPGAAGPIDSRNFRVLIQVKLNADARHRISLRGVATDRDGSGGNIPVPDLVLVPRR